MNREGEKYKPGLCKFKVWITSGEHIELITPLVVTSQSMQVLELIGFSLEWINELSTDQILYHHNFATTQAIFKQKRLAWDPEYVGSQNMKLHVVKMPGTSNSWKFGCEFCMFYSIWQL